MGVVVFVGGLGMLPLTVHVLGQLARGVEELILHISVKKGRLFALGRETIRLFCQAYDAVMNSWSPRVQKLLVELSSCGKAKRREAVSDMVDKQFETTVLPLVQQVRKVQKPKRKTRKPKAAEQSKTDESEMADAPTNLQQPEKGTEAQAEGSRKQKKPDAKGAPAMTGEPKTPVAASKEPRRRGCIRDRSPPVHKQRQSQLNFPAATPGAQTPSSTETTPKSPPPKTPTWNRMDLREDNQEENSDSSSDKSCPGGDGGSPPVDVTPLHGQTRSMQLERKEGKCTQTTTSTSGCKQTPTVVGK